jgi:hypothetical protein
MSPNVTYGVSLESYHPYLQPQKIPKIYCIHSTLPKNAKSHFGSLGPLRIKIHSKLDFFFHAAFCCFYKYSNLECQNDTFKKVHLK